LIELINVSKDEDGKLNYPALIKTEGIGPSQYGTKGMVGDKLTEVEEKYDLTKVTEGFILEGEADSQSDESEEEEGEEKTDEEVSEDEV